MKLYRIIALLLKYYYLTVNRIDRLFDLFYWPMIDLIVWGFASYFIAGISDYNLLSMFLGGIILWVFVWRASQDIAVYVLEDFWSRSLYHLFSSPVKISEHIISVILVGFLRGLVTFVILSIMSFIIYSFKITSIPLLYIAVAIAILSIFGWIVGLFVTAMILCFGKRIQVLAWSTSWLVQPFSCIFYPLSALPAWAVPIAKVLPTMYVFENLRNVLYQNSVNYMELLYAFSIEVVLLIIMAFFLKWAFERSRKTGLLAKAD